MTPRARRKTRAGRDVAPLRGEAPTEYEVMMGCVSFKARRFTRGMPVVVAAALLCLGVLPSLSIASGSEGSSTLGKTNMLRVDRGSNRNAPPARQNLPLLRARGRGER